MGNFQEYTPGVHCTCPPNEGLTMLTIHNPLVVAALEEAQDLHSHHCQCSLVQRAIALRQRSIFNSAQC